MSDTDDVQGIYAAIERGYQAMRQSAAAIAVLYARGAATCNDVKGYNLIALGIYNTQRVMLDALNANGVSTSGMTVPPTPTLFYWNGVAGTDAALVDCSTSSAMAGLGAAPSGFLAPGSLRIVTADPDWQNPQPTLTAAQIASGLGNPVLIYLVVAAIAFAIYEGFSTLKAYLVEHETTVQVADQVDAIAKAHAGVMTARAGYMTNCKGDQGTCARDAINLYPELDISSVKYPSTPGSGLGVFGWIGVVAVAAVGGVALWRKYERDGHILPRKAAS